MTLRRLVAALRPRRLVLAGGGAPATAALALGLLAVARGHLVAPRPTVLVTDRHGQPLADLGGDDASGYGYWPLAELPPRVVAATLAVEDRRFFSHPGVDPRAVARAVRQNLGAGERVSGASTLAMQVARLQRPGPRGYLRKAVEAATALVVTARAGRLAVLRHYLAIVPYGNQAHGIAYAARRYFAKPVEDLSWAEVAFLTAIPQAPARMNPYTPGGRRRAIERGRRILDLLAAQGILSRGEQALAAQQIGDLVIPARGRRPETAMHALLAVEARLAHRWPERGGVVATTLDLELQSEAAWQVERAVATWRDRGVGNAALLVVDRASWEVLAWVGSSGYFDADHAGAIDFARVPRSPGSTLKPFIYALGLERGVITPATVLDDLERGAGGIGNADERFLGPLLPRAALGNSRNVTAANLVEAIGLDQVYAFLGTLGLHDGRVAARQWGLGLAIGGMPVTLEQLVTAYTAVAGDGRLERLRLLAGEAMPPSQRVLSEGTARQVADFLADPMARLPSFPRMGPLEYPFPVAAKTGTSSNYHDAWTVAWSRRYLVAAWVGHPDFYPMNRLSGFHSAARLVNAVLTGLHPGELDGIGDVGFPARAGASPVRLCALTGRLAAPACERVAVEYLSRGETPVERCSAHVRLAVDRRSGLPATAATPASDRDLRTFTDLGPRYARWQAAADLPLPPSAPPAAGGARHSLMTAAAARVTITAPRPRLRLLRDPETPPALATLALEAVVEPPAPQVVWYVDGQPFAVADYPYTTRWPLAPGRHSFEARLPACPIGSGAVEVTVF